MADEENAEEIAEEVTGGGMKKMIMFGGIGVVLILIGIFAGPAVMNMISPPEEAADEDTTAVVAAGPPIYQSLHPPLVVNFKDGEGDSHFMQITMEIMARDQGVINLVRENIAVIRNALILLYSSAIYEEVTTRAGKEKMLEDGLAEIERVMVDTTGEGGVEALYFTALVIQ